MRLPALHHLPPRRRRSRGREDLVAASLRMADFRRGLQNSKRVGFWKIEVYYIGITRGYYDRFSRPLSELPDLWLEASGNELF